MHDLKLDLVLLKKFLIQEVLQLKLMGNDIYPPVEKTFTIFCFFNKKIDFKVKNKIINELNGSKKILLSFGVLIISNL